MSSPFDALDAALSGAILSAFGETEAASLRPWTRSEYAEAADTVRPVRPIRGVFSESHDTAQLRGAAMASEHRGVTRLSVHQAEFWVPASEVAGLPYAIRQGDRLAFPARDGSPVFTVSDMQRDETGDLNLILTISE